MTIAEIINEIPIFLRAIAVILVLAYLGLAGVWTYKLIRRKDDE